MRILKKEIWPYRMQGDIDKKDAIDHWLTQNISSFKYRWNAVSNDTRLDYYFRNSKDASMFSLRWL